MSETPTLAKRLRSAAANTGNNVIRYLLLDAAVGVEEGERREMALVEALVKMTAERDQAVRDLAHWIGRARAAEVGNAIALKESEDSDTGA